MTLCSGGGEGLRLTVKQSKQRASWQQQAIGLLPLLCRLPCLTNFPRHCTSAPGTTSAPCPPPAAGARFCGNHGRAVWRTREHTAGKRGVVHTRRDAACFSAHCAPAINVRVVPCFDVQRGQVLREKRQAGGGEVGGGGRVLASRSALRGHRARSIDIPGSPTRLHQLRQVLLHEVAELCRVWKRRRPGKGRCKHCCYVLRHLGPPLAALRRAPTTCSPALAVACAGKFSRHSVGLRSTL